ncbi:hypothetical protein N7516_009114 [Penicillium verrucosum]|uniref:uncharacterized protein n=1 Tax=Penicillium verrucosum TaxID=60171 RepID=UPI0025452E09|nr:uncharacterized protein N7516_009114 [Penicillium verrucosum]KAJ5927341.1 hypothetical protein N7516_009114 [Penicillium verrucosum]
MSKIKDRMIEPGGSFDDHGEAMFEDSRLSCRMQGSRKVEKPRQSYGVNRIRGENVHKYEGAQKNQQR